MEAMNALENPWDGMHHHASFLPNLECLKVDIKNLDFTDNVQWKQSRIIIHDVFTEGNLVNISKTFPINILVNPGVMENILIGVDYYVCSLP
jgi:hypothetical protein